MMANKSFIYRFSDVEVREREFSLLKAGKVLAVEPRAFHVLLVFLRHPQELISKEELLNSVWGDTAVTEGSLTRCIWLLRRLLGDDVNQPRYIETVATVGYRFLQEVQVTEDGHLPLGIPVPNDHHLTESDAAATERPRTGDRLTQPRMQSSQRWAAALVIIGVAVIVGMIVIVVGRFRRSAAQKVPSVSVHSLAVLPFENLSGDTEQEYFADWMTAELITELAKYLRSA